MLAPPLQYCVGYEDAPLGMQAIKAAGFLKVQHGRAWGRQCSDEHHGGVHMAGRGSEGWAGECQPSSMQDPGSKLEPAPTLLGPDSSPSHHTLAPSVTSHSRRANRAVWNTLSSWLLLPQAVDVTQMEGYPKLVE